MGKPSTADLRMGRGAAKGDINFVAQRVSDSGLGGFRSCALARFGFWVLGLGLGFSKFGAKTAGV